jgi:hypothetical protein
MLPKLLDAVNFYFSYCTKLQSADYDPIVEFFGYQTEDLENLARILELLNKPETDIATLESAMSVARKLY